MNATQHELLKDAQAWRLMGRLLERPQSQWHADVRALTDGPIADDLRQAAKLADDATEGGYLASFGPSGVVSPREVGHAGMRDPGHVLADLQARYDAFAFRPSAEDTLDHVAVETGFVAYLRLKEAFALAEGDTEHAAITRDAAEAFIADHLREMAEPIANKLEAVAESYLAGAARALARRVGSPKQGSTAKVVWLEEEDVMSCGEAPGVAG